MTAPRVAEAAERELGGCPVMHRDFAPQQAAGCHGVIDSLENNSGVL